MGSRAIAKVRRRAGTIQTPVFAGRREIPRECAGAGGDWADQGVGVPDLAGFRGHSLVLSDSDQRIYELNLIDDSGRTHVFSVKRSDVGVAARAEDHAVPVRKTIAAPQV